MYGINDILENLCRNDYSEHLSEKEYEIDCSLGENPYGVFPELEAEAEIFREISAYPHSEENVINEIIKRYSDVADLNIDNISLTCGSMGGLICLNRIFLKEGKNVIGIAPQFSAIIDDFNTYNVNYIPVYLNKENNYKFEVEKFIQAIRDNDNAYIYIDNPNNPTGQAIPVEDIEKIISEAEKHNSFVCIDEAYGDYMDNKNSAMALIPKYENLAVFRTLSKGLGGAGLRMGYIISNERFIKIYRKVNIPFATTGIANYIAEKVINSGWETYAVEKSLVQKKELMDSLKNLKVAHTSLEVPIGMYYVDNDVDLEEIMIDNGIRVVSCRGYCGLKENAVRINLNKDYEKLKTLLLKVDRSFD